MLATCFPHSPPLLPLHIYNAVFLTLSFNSHTHTQTHTHTHTHTHIHIHRVRQRSRDRQAKEERDRDKDRKKEDRETDREIRTSLTHLSLLTAYGSDKIRHAFRQWPHFHHFAGSDAQTWLLQGYAGVRVSQLQDAVPMCQEQLLQRLGGSRCHTRWWSPGVPVRLHGKPSVLPFACVA